MTVNPTLVTQISKYTLCQARDTVRNSISKKKEKEKTGLLIAGLSTDDVKRLEKEVSSIIFTFELV